MSRPPFSAPQEIAEWIRASLPVESGVLGLALFCAPDASGKALCLMDVDRSAVAAVTRQFRGQPFGFTSVTVNVPLAEGFLCRARQDGPPARRCSCHPEWPPAEK